MADCEDQPRVFCTACQMEIVGLEERRKHYRSDFHLVNLKRKMAGLGPLTEAEYAERLALLAEKKKAEEQGKPSPFDGVPGQQGGNISNRKRRQREKVVCEACSKTFSSMKAYENHVKSRRHLDALKRYNPVSEISSSATMESMGTDMETETDGEVDENAMWIDEDDDNDTVEQELQRRMNEWDDSNSHRQSPFDGHVSTNAHEALKYMAKHSGFFVPYAEHLADADGLVRYLCQKVCIGYTCVCCDKSFASVADVRRHMVDTGHERMTPDTSLFREEYSDFYDWSRPADDDGTGEWTEVSADDQDQLESNKVVVVDPDYDAGPREAPADTTDPDEQAYGLAIGSKIIGHRSLVRYYKQAAATGIDMRDAVVAGRSASEMRIAAWKADRKRINQVQAAGQTFAKRRQQYFELAVGQSNYYVRKSKLRQNLVVLNSGYRA